MSKFYKQENICKCWKKNRVHSRDMAYIYIYYQKMTNVLKKNKKHENDEKSS